MATAPARGARDDWWGGLQNGVGRTLGVGVLLLASVVFGIAVFSQDAWTLWAVVAVVVALAVIWRRPVVAVYLLLGGAALFETFQLHYPDSLTDRVPFFRSVESLGGSLPIPFSPAELIMLGTLAVVVLTRGAERRAPLELGPFWLPMVVFMLVLAAGIIHGLATGGSFLIMTWEFRALLYVPVVYLLVVNLVRSRRQVHILFWVLLIGIGVKGLLGTWRYAVTLGGDLSRKPELATTNSIMSHGESYLYALFLAIVLALWLLRSSRPQLIATLAFTPLVGMALLANERRAGILALLLGLLLVLFLIYVTVRERRRVIAFLALAILVAAPLYVAAFADGEGLLAEPASAITSTFEPDERDRSSNEARAMENENLKRNIARSPVWGHGFGKPIPELMPVVDIGEFFSLWNYIPHNSILWLWHRIGFVGLAAFWVMAGRFIVGAVLATRSADPYLRMVAVTAVVAIVAWLSNAALDLALTTFRPSIVIGTLVGLLAVIPRLEEEEPSAGEASPGPARESRPPVRPRGGSGMAKGVGITVGALAVVLGSSVTMG